MKLNRTKRLSDSSSASSNTQSINTPEPFHGVDKGPTSHMPSEILQRSSSLLSSIKDRRMGGTWEEKDAEVVNYTEKHIYEDLNDEEKSLKRSQSRISIINTLEARIAEEKSWIERGNDLELALKRTQSIYDNAEREDALPTVKDGVEFNKIDPELVTWESDDDPKNPRNWSLGRKWRSVLVITLFTLLSPFASTMLSPAISDISKEFGVTNTTVSSLMVSIYLLAWVLFPPIVAPLSEMYGRKIVLDVSIWMLFIFNLACGLSQNATQMCIFRLLAGLGGSAPICIGAGVLSDVFNRKDIGVAMSLYSIGPSVGPCISALVAGIIVDHVDWRWCFWVLCILNGSLAVYGNIFMEETYAPTLLNRKAKALRKQTGNENLHSLYDIATGETTYERFYNNLSRPLRLLFTHPMVYGLGIFMAIVYGCLYTLIVCFPTVFAQQYGFSKTGTGLMYISFTIGYLTGTAVTQRIADGITERLIAKNGGVSKPEFRLPLLLQSGVLCAVGLFWFGWGAQKKMNYIFTGTGAAIFAYGVIAVFYTIQNYLIEMNPRFAASSIAAASLFRALMGFAFPLFAPKMFDNLGYGWGCSIFGFIAIATGIPFPIFVIAKGEKLRLWANRNAEKYHAKLEARYIARLKAQALAEEKAKSQGPTKPKDNESQSS